MADTIDGGGRKYVFDRVIGNGAFGIVWKVRDTTDADKTLAMKKVVLDRRYHNRELDVIKKLDHECVVKLVNYFEHPGTKPDESYLHLVMEYMPETIRSVMMDYHKNW